MTLKEVIQRLLRQAKLVGGVVGVILFVVMLWTFLAAPRYESLTALRIMDGGSALELSEDVPSVPGMDFMGLRRDQLSTEMGVLRSWRMAEAAVDSLALMVRMRKPVGIRSEVLRVVVQGDPDWEGIVTLELGPDGAYAASAKEKGEARESLGQVRAGESFSFGGYVVVVQPVPSVEAAPRRIRLKVVPRYEAIKDLREDLDIQRGERSSRLVEIAYRSTDRDMAAAIVNSIAQTFIEYSNQSQRSEARYTAAELRKQVADYGARLVHAEERLRRYQEVQLIVAPEEEAIQQVNRIAQLQLQQDAAKVELDALAELLALVEDRAGADSPDSPDAGAYDRLATYPSFISHRGMQNILRAIQDLENQRSLLQGRRTDQNRDVLQLTERIRDLENQLHALGVSYRDNLDGRLASVQTALDRLTVDLEALPEREMEYLRLLRDRTVLDEAYVLLQGQLSLTEVQDAIRGEGVRIVDVGIIAHEDDPEFPKPAVNLFLGLVLGLTAGMSVALGKDLWEADEVPSG
jgi:tyrosine-protein kinase Etk/Wzc